MKSIVYDIKSKEYFDPLLININSIYDEVLDLGLTIVFLLHDQQITEEFITYIKKYTNVFLFLHQPSIVYSLYNMTDYIVIPILSIILPNSLQYIINHTKSNQVCVDSSIPIVEIVRTTKEKLLQSDSEMWYQQRIYLFEGLDDKETIRFITQYHRKGCDSVISKN